MLENIMQTELVYDNHFDRLIRHMYVTMKPDNTNCCQFMFILFCGTNLRFFAMFEVEYLNN